LLTGRVFATPGKLGFYPSFFNRFSAEKGCDGFRLLLILCKPCATVKSRKAPIFKGVYLRHDFLRPCKTLNRMSCVASRKDWPGNYSEAVLFKMNRSIRGIRANCTGEKPAHGVMQCGNRLMNARASE
jgi:hypothetical protein